MVHAEYLKGSRHYKKWHNLLLYGAFLSFWFFFCKCTTTVQTFPHYMSTWVHMSTLNFCPLKDSFYLRAVLFYFFGS